MQVDRPIVPISAAVEEAVITFRISHPETLSRSLNRKLYLSSPSSFLPLDLQPQPAQSGSGGNSHATKQAVLRDLEVKKYKAGVRRLIRGREVAEREEERFRREKERLREEIQRERQALEREKQKTAETERVKESHEKCNAVVKEMAARPKQRAELDDLISSLHSQITLQTSKKSSYLSESLSRLSSFQSLPLTLQALISLPKTDPDRNIAELVVKEKEVVAKVAGVSRVGSAELGVPVGLQERVEKEVVGSVAGGAGSGAGKPPVGPGASTSRVAAGKKKESKPVEIKPLDPKVPAFIPSAPAPTPVSTSSTTTTTTTSSRPSKSSSTLPFIAGLPSKPVGSFLDVPKSSVKGNQAMSMSSGGGGGTTVSGRGDRAGTPAGSVTGRERERGRGVATASGSGRNARPGLTVTHSSGAVPGAASKPREDGEMSDPEEGELSTHASGSRGGAGRGKDEVGGGGVGERSLKRTRGEEEDEVAKRRRMGV